MFYHNFFPDFNKAVFGTRHFRKLANLDFLHFIAHCLHFRFNFRFVYFC